MAEYRCENCGYVAEGDNAPEECPVCKHKDSFEQITE